MRDFTKVREAAKKLFLLWQCHCGLNPPPFELMAVETSTFEKSFFSLVRRPLPPPLPSLLALPFENNFFCGFPKENPKINYGFNVQGHHKNMIVYRVDSTKRSAYSVLRNHVFMEDLYIIDNACISSYQPPPP